MKKLYILAGSLLMATGAFAQGHDLFFSGYNEGAHASGSTPPGGGAASNGQEYALQIFNPTTATVNMGEYSVGRYNNGGSTVFQEERCVRNKPTTGLPNTLTSGDVFVIGSDRATLTEILNNWDQQSSPYNSTAPTVISVGGPVTFNGNDAVVLHRWTGGTAGVGTPVMIDLIGVIGQDPAGGAWFSNTPTFPVDVATKNMSLRRKGNIENGTRINPNPATYQIGDEWEVHSAWDATAPTPASWYAQSYSNLSGHAQEFALGGGQYGSYLPLSTLEEFDSAIKVFPNPSVNKSINIEVANKKVASIEIINGIGQNIRVVPSTGLNQNLKVDVSSLKPGLYFVKFIANDEYNTKLFKKIIVQ